jgi:hypothetical protein
VSFTNGNFQCQYGCASSDNTCPCGSYQVGAVYKLNPLDP